ncbi:MAG: polysaccharide pyruvyl transferase family protein [Akkermansiaceae bacterium]|nr:polysaccharide pyruvyl transferase family protein [Akkermansiaceae bacterium]NNM30964.1 polysaccharide pyruvyl transferase family protein [Akkermansiaceae bacterium]
MRTLVLGWFSFEYYGATAGDLMAKDVVCEWLDAAGHSFDVALAPPFEGGVDWRTIDPAPYTHLLFVCGPFGESPDTVAFLERFGHCRKIGINLSMLQDLDEWNPFDLLIERDSSKEANPDISLLCDQPKVPVVGLCLVEPQEEYRKRARHREANEAFERLVDSREMAVVPIDTRLDKNGTGLRTPAEVESLLAGMDVVLTTRLHGTALSLKNGVPAVALDAIVGGAKVTRQAGVLDWPVCFQVETVTDEQLGEAFDYCLTAEARAKARECAAAAQRVLAGLRRRFLDEVDAPTSSNAS